MSTTSHYVSASAPRFFHPPEVVPTVCFSPSPTLNSNGSTPLRAWNSTAPKLYSPSSWMAHSRRLCVTTRAKSKLEGVRGKRDELTKENRLNTSSLLKFNRALIRQFCAEAVDRLGSDQRRAIEAVCYAMQATDDVLFDANQLATALGNSKG